VSDSMRLTDDQITSMLLERAASPMPPDLSAAVLASVRAAHDRPDRLPRRGTLLLVAATLLVGASLLTAGFAGSVLVTPPRPTAAPALVEATTTNDVGQTWTTDSSPAFTVTRDPSDQAALYWRATTYDLIGLKDFAHSETRIVVRKAGTPLLDTLADDATQAGLRTFTLTVDPIGFDQSTMVSPATPVEADERSRVSYVGETGFLAMLDRDGGSGPYEITSRVLVNGNGPGQVNETALRAAGADYPSEVVALFTRVEPGSFGPNARALEARILAETESRAPIDLADRLVTVLQSNAYTYDTDIRDLPCKDLSTVECFATFKRGFCQYYAATMAVILRDMGVPTRIAQGFLPGTHEAGGIERVPMSSAHAWVEVYFPGYGWVPFDPTGRPLGQIGPLPSGPPIGSAAPSSAAP
jgi:Transglutaminase-like superfamily